MKKRRRFSCVGSAEAFPSGKFFASRYCFCVVDDNPRQSQIVVMKTERGYLSVDITYPQRWLRVAARGDDSIPSISRRYCPSAPAAYSPPAPFRLHQGNVSVEIQNLPNAAIDLGDEPHRALTSIIRLMVFKCLKVSNFRRPEAPVYIVRSKSSPLPEAGSAETSQVPA